jgi:hypothetical protein
MTTPGLRRRFPNKSTNFAVIGVFTGILMAIPGLGAGIPEFSTRFPWFRWSFKGLGAGFQNIFLNKFPKISIRGIQMNFEQVFFWTSGNIWRASNNVTFRWLFQGLGANFSDLLSVQYETTGFLQLTFLGMTFPDKNRYSRIRHVSCAFPGPRKSFLNFFLLFPGFGTSFLKICV